MGNDENTLNGAGTLLASVATRRGFLRNAAVGALGASTLAACQKAPSADVKGTPVTGAVGGTVADSDHSGGSMAPHPAAISDRARADEMDRMHEAGVIRSNAKKIVADGTDWRFLNELKKELKA